MGLGVGSSVPDFTLPDQDGKETSFKSLLDSAEKGVVLFFYPKDQTTGCIAEVKPPPPPFHPAHAPWNRT
jgi:peroxiredoxin Q/BCP